MGVVVGVSMGREIGVAILEPGYIGPELEVGDKEQLPPDNELR